jgi:hypothetical protein
MGREAQATIGKRVAVIPSLEMRILNLEAALHQISEACRVLVTDQKRLTARVQALETQGVALRALQADDVRRLQLAIGAVQTAQHGTRWARLRWWLGI